MTKEPEHPAGHYRASIPGGPPARPRFGLFGRILIAFLLISALPIALFGLVTFFSITSVGDEIVEHVFDTLDRKTRETMELQAVLTAKSAGKFLEQRVIDLLDIGELVPTDFNYLQFSDQHESIVWHRTGTKDNPGEARTMLPLYKEVAFIDPAGQERIRISNNRILPPDSLRNVSDPRQTTYRSETYFREALRLANGEVYVSHVTGFWVSREEQLGGAESIEKAVEGAQYDGVVRFATPVYAADSLIGIVVLSLDHRHLMELTQHILPNSKEETVFPVYSSGDYAFMFDDQGWIITHPKYWDIPGVDDSGDWVPAFSAMAKEAGFDNSNLPFNLDSAGHVHENYPRVAREVRAGRSGSVITTNVGGIIKVMAYAPIAFTHGAYSRHGVFGGITIGAEIQGFRGHAMAIAGDITRAVTLVRNNILLAILLTIVLALIVSWLLSRSFARPIVEITNASQRLARGEPVRSAPLQRSDEIGVLSRTFNNMALELDANRQDLLQSMADLERSKTEVESYARDLEYQLNVFRSIQRISNILGSTVQLDDVLKTILRRCVAGLGFDRAILYLIDDQGKYLEYREMHGFSPEEEELARRSRYNLERFDCIETRVVQTGQIAFVEEFADYPAATSLDRKIRRVSKSTSFAFVPLKVKERIIGILGADKLRTGEKVRQLDVNSLQVLANQAARVIENTRLYQEVLSQRNFVENVVESMLNGVITIDPHGVITSINRAAASILEMNPESLVGSTLAEALSAYPALADPIAAATNDDRASSLHDIEVPMRHSLKSLSVYVSRLGGQYAADEESGAIVIIEDSTERKRIDDHLHRVERLASLGRFAAGIAHEIRNPVTGINVFLDDLHDKLAADSDLAPLIGRALTEVERLDTLVNEILDYASPSRGELVQRNINDVVAATLRFIDKQCREHRVRVLADLPDNLPDLMMDGEKIRQALLNITLNAIQVMPDGGELRITTRSVEKPEEVPDSRSADRWLAIDVADNGPGIPREEREQIFEPFFSRRPGGTGLGLSLTQTIIADHGGKIVVAENAPHGTRFTIYLPVAFAGQLSADKTSRKGSV